ncbi:hypothetical protein EMPG_11272 [Blastomyces silverae]|uniref:Uncharacterized protein n=1 Tax=Blastomyces silverae TaxID=2060906 RepID=A0A0H1BRW7_9EURO|nr:hypothetical protein EMPG_11272 [Blastomyces silverae]
MVYKLQDLLLNKIVLNITKKNFTADLIYVTVSQMKSYQELLFEKMFNYHRFCKDESDTMKMRCLNAERCQQECVIAASTTSTASSLPSLSSMFTGAFDLPIHSSSSPRLSLCNSLLPSFDDLYDVDLI